MWLDSRYVFLVNSDEVRVMNNNDKLKLILASLLVLGFASAVAQDSTDDHADVWSTIEESWNAEESGDKKWVERLLTDDFSGWGKSSPAPQGKSSIEMWDRFDDQMGKMLAHELYPLSIVVHEDVAIAHYLYTTAYKPRDGEIEMGNGRYTEVLVRTDDGWKFIAWHGGDD